MVLSVSFLDTGLLRVLLPHNDLLAALREVKDTEEELRSFLGAFSDDIVGFMIEMVVSRN